MIQSFDFLIHAKNSPELKEQIIKHMQMEEDSEMIHYNAIIKFDSKNKIIREDPLEGAPLAIKILPIEFSYDAFYRFMDSEDPWLIVEKEFKIFR